MAARRVTPKTKIFELSVVLQHLDPPVRRQVQVPGEITLAELHRVLQVAMGWDDDHLHEFDVAGARYGSPDFGLGGVADETQAKLFRLVGEGDQLEYVYDFGDGWTHAVTVEQVLPVEPQRRYPRCLAGQRACPPEDVGGPWGYAEFLAAITDPGHDEHDNLLDWNGGSFDPETFDATAVDQAFDRMGWIPLRSTAPAAGTTSASSSP